MKKPTSVFKNIIVATCLPLAGLTLSANVQAADIGKKFYIGLNIVPVSYRENTIAQDFALINTILARSDYNNPTISQEASSSGTLLTIGKELSEKWSVELGIKDYGEQKVTYKNTRPASAGVTSASYTIAKSISASSTLLGAKYNFRPQATVNVYTKFGFESWSADVKRSNTASDASLPAALRSTTTTSSSGSDLALAVGIDFPTKIGVFQAELAPSGFESVTGQELLSSDFTFGYHYKF